jgi:hypothetical protein
VKLRRLLTAGLIALSSAVSGSATYINFFAAVSHDSLLGFKKCSDEFFSTYTSGDPLIPMDGTVPQNTEGVAVPSLDCTYTPTSATSILEVEIYEPITVPLGGNLGSTIALFRDSGADAIAAAILHEMTIAYRRSGLILKTPALAGSTAPTTFKIRVGNQITNPNVYLNSDATATLQVYDWGNSMSNPASISYMVIREWKQ